MFDRKLIEDYSIITDFKVKSDSAKVLKSTVEMCFTSDKTIFTHFKKEGPILKLYRGDYGADKDEAGLLPYPLTKDNAYYFIYAWLHSFDEDERTWENKGGDGSHAIGFKAEWFDFGNNADVIFEAINIYYSK